MKQIAIKMIRIRASILILGIWWQIFESVSLYAVQNAIKTLAINTTKSRIKTLKPKIPL
jgi:hypothetical protein